MEVRRDDVMGVKTIALLQEHLDNMKAISPPESVHALELDELRSPRVTFWSIWEGDDLMGCGALKEIGPGHGEIKSMRTAMNFRRRGVAAKMVEHILAEAIARKYARLSLETGSQDEFLPARRLYERYGFDYCSPFGDYRDDPHSVFMTKALLTETG